MAPPLFDGDLPAAVRSALSAGIDVFAVGLDLDWRGQPFEVTARLAAMADRVVKRAAVCTACGAAATKTWKKSQSGGVVELGEADAYEARCDACWSPPP